MENKTSPSKSGLQYGVLFGIIMVLEFVITYLIGMKSLVGTSVGVLVNTANYLILPLLFIYLGCNNYKKNFNHGFISFGECLKTGVSITVIAALIYAIFNVIFNLIFPEFTDEMIAISRSEMIKNAPNMSNEQLETSLGMMKKFMSPYIVFPFTIAMYAFFGLIYSMIVGAFIKNEKPQSI